MKKMLILILIVILISGCEAVYTLEINGDNFKESFEISNNNPSSWGNGDGSYDYGIRRNAQANIATDSRNNENLETNERISGINYYDISLIESSQNLGVNYNATFNIDEYRYSALAVTHFNQFRANLTRNGINIISGRLNNIFEAYLGFRKLTVKVITNHEVFEHNADEVQDDILYWYFTKDNYEDKEVRIRMSESANENPDLWQMDSKGAFGMNSLIGVYILILVLGIASAIVIFVKVKNSNR